MEGLNPDKVMSEWFAKVERGQQAHGECVSRLRARGKWLGIPTIILAYTVGTAIFASLQVQPDLWIQISMGIIAMTAGVLAALQTFLNYPERARAHQTTAARYAAIKRELKVEMSMPSEKRTDPRGFLDGIRGQLDQIDEEADVIPWKLSDLIEGAKGT